VKLESAANGVARGCETLLRDGRERVGPFDVRLEPVHEPVQERRRTRRAKFRAMGVWGIAEAD